jgi:hypothetical protein
MEAKHVVLVPRKRYPETTKNKHTFAAKIFEVRTSFPLDLSWNVSTFDPIVKDDATTGLQIGNASLFA